MTKTIKTDVCILGGGIAGAWLGYRLVQRGISAVILRSGNSLDTIHTPIVSHLAASVMDKRFFEPDGAGLPAVLADETGTQDPLLLPVIRQYLPGEFAELSKLVEFTDFQFAVIPRNQTGLPMLGEGKRVLETVLDQFAALGGTVLEGCASHLTVEDGICHGVQYHHEGSEIQLLCGAIVIASGGFCGLFADSASGNTGGVLGMFAQAGGHLANLEFTYRHTLGEMTTGRVLRPEELKGAAIVREGRRAEWLERMHDTVSRERRDIEVFQKYWVHNIGVPHWVELNDVSLALGPIHGFSMGGIAQRWRSSSLTNVYTTGEASYDLTADCIIGRPWATYLSTSGMLCDLLCDRSLAVQVQDFPLRPASEPLHAKLLSEVKNSLKDIQDDFFPIDQTDRFVKWCRDTRSKLSASREECRRVLILAEAYALSGLQRTESSGFFFRADYPGPNPGLKNLVTYATYNADSNQASVELIPRDAVLAGKVPDPAAGRLLG